LRFEAGDALVEEAVVRAGGPQAFFQGALPAGEVADALPERGVFGGEPADGVGVVLVLGVAELAEQFADAGTLGVDLGMRGLEGLLGVQRPLLRGRLRLGVPRCDVVLSARVMAAVTTSRAAGLS